ncbi:MAG TPA: Crp/Fnr family transcriptional regulator [Candidatus Wujingus californicus]|uniref:Crp/Fnr family transcriptional regulator n=1 Tax=Candidatus Wujingus californicus TaxID=3367618 RepID=UPI004026FEDF
MSEKAFLEKLYNDCNVIVEEGSQSRTMYVIQSGKVKVVKKEGGRETTLAFLGEGDIFGEMSLFDASPRSATIVAVGEARVLAIEHEGLLKKIKMDPTLAFNIIKQMSRRIRNLNSKLSTIFRTITDTNDKLKKFNPENIETIQKELQKLYDTFIQMDLHTH